jgi:hypothetical protein
MRAVVITAVVVVVLGLIGVLNWVWVIRYMIGPVEKIEVLQCGTYKDVIPESSGKPGDWCMLKAEYYITKAVGIPHSDQPLVITALVERGGMHNSITTIYAPSSSEFVMLAVSMGALVGGSAGLGSVALLRRRAGT